MTDLLQAASEALGAPPELVSRSAAARASANGTTVDDVLAAWSGGTAAATPAAVDVVAEPTAEPAPEPAAEPVPAEVPVEQIPAEPVSSPEVGIEPEPELTLDPVPLTMRLKTAVRIGSWTGAALGVLGFLVATAFWVANTTTVEGGGPVVEVSPTTVIVGMALVSVVFGAIVAGVSRAATAWVNPAMQLSGSKSATAWLGAVVGLGLGVVVGALLAGFGTQVEGSEPPLTQLPVLPTLFVMVIGGAVLGAATALIPQVLGVPVAVGEAETEEVEKLRGRLGNAVSIPVAGLMIFVLLVLPFAYALIQSNQLIANGGAIVAIIAAAGILGFSALAGTKPEMRISFGDLLVALIGIGVVLLIVISVLFYIGNDEGEPAESGEAHSITRVV